MVPTEFNATTSEPFMDADLLAGENVYPVAFSPHLLPSPPDVFMHDFFSLKTPLLNCDMI